MMKQLKLLSVFILTLFVTSCYTEVIEEHHFDTSPIHTTPTATVNELLHSYDLWYIDINKTLGYGETPFLQIAFTVSFKNGVLYANNNLVGIGKQGDGLGIPVGNYDAHNMILNVNHTIHGFDTFDVYQIDYNTIELYNPNNDTSYFLEGYQTYNFDYDYVFYDNIHYFLQEYDAWEKTFTSKEGVLNEFDNENYLQFLAGGDDIDFRSSQDPTGIKPKNVIWDYTGIYGIQNVTANLYLKKLTLDYDYFANEHFELSVINDKTIELFHPTSGTLYEFTGRGYIQYMRKAAKTDLKNSLKKRKQHTQKTENPRHTKQS